MALIESIRERIAQLETELRNSLQLAAVVRDQANLASDKARREEGALMELNAMLEQLQRLATQPGPGTGE